MSELERERKWIVRVSSLPKSYEDFRIRQSYIEREDDIAERIRETRKCYSTYVSRIHMTKKWLGEGVSEESDQREINETEYKTLRANRIGKEIIKRRIVFLYKEQKFELDIFEKPIYSLCLLELEMEDMDKEVKFPPFLKIIKEVTGDRRFSNHFIAKNAKKVTEILKEIESG